MAEPGSIAVAEEVRAAVADGRPVVALESTIFTHGLPRPRNLAVARAAEEQLRAAGVVPATVGVLDGVPTVGLSAAEIERLGGAESAVKLSTRDLAVAAVRRLSGGTTVAATSYLAHRAGIRVFATGGIGGVHRGADRTFDESADLVALATVPVVVVSAGVKSILDIPATLERLETLNVPVIGYRTRRFPAFYVTESEYALEYGVDGPGEAAALFAAHRAVGLTSALLVANPVPAHRQLDPARHEALLADALAAADAARVTGHDITPFLLDHLQRASGGETLEVNVAVYRNNIAVAAEIAIALSGPRG